MSKELNAIVAVSFIVLLLLSALRARQTGAWRSFLLGAAALAILALILNRLFGFPFPPPTAKSLSDDLRRAIPLFAAMLAGMFAQYAYTRYERPKRHRLKWDWGLFIAPVFASPIIFIPLFAAFLKSDAKDERELSLMILLVAFQNGFFWKEHYDHKRMEESSTSTR